MADAGTLSFRDVPQTGLAIISPNDPGAMVNYAGECRALGIRYIFDPGQQCARMSGDELRDGITVLNLSGPLTLGEGTSMFRQLIDDAMQPGKPFRAMSPSTMGLVALSV